ncbi:hypothetical protein Dsin_013088 [Dipteronia sinensis]|uniref:Peptidase C14 caspase domain-containing protein n=1 Tax=Dipteronia sinensis TaxID=43782 RepID=A0AAE0AJA4_9ROSI|nr:hypothetical protein Dsin_013088 [Dipteronia sinensis]
MEKGKQRMVVQVGCNYPNTKNELCGCINDVVAMNEVLIKRLGFKPSGMELLIDAPRPGPNFVMPTGANMEPGRPFRKDEAIVPIDLNLITYLDFRQLVNRIPKGPSFTFLLDSCHSGGLIDREKQQIGPSSSIIQNYC